MSAWQPDEPIELGNGLLVCGAHREMICVRCCVDYSFMLDMKDHEEETTGSARARKGDDEGEDHHINEADNLLQSATRKPLPISAQEQYRDGDTLIIPKIDSFVPPTSTVTPQELFPLQQKRGREFLRFVHRANPRDILIYTDGACLNNGQPNPAAGWGFVFRESEPSYPGAGRVMGRLEDHGPSGEPHPQTSNRAELRAVLAALQFRAWFREGWKTLVIATDSEYVTKGATEWVRTWGRNGWVTCNRTAVKNRDMWEVLLGEIIGYQQSGMEIFFWRIPRACNKQADDLAKAGARKERRQKFATILGSGV